MFAEGVYGLSFRGAGSAAPAPHAECVEALAILRAGKILGSDRWGGIFRGFLEFDPVARQSKICVRMDVPPDGELITGFAAGPDGASFDIVAEFGQSAPMALTTIDVAGHPVDVEFQFLGPLPN